MKIIANKTAIALLIAAVSSGIISFDPRSASAHCDTMDGPVIKAAQKALDTGNVNLVLLWVRHEDEPAIRQAFERTLSVRKLSAEAKALADTAFFETLVRIHRAGEGAAYMGVKPTGTDLGPAIPAADKAVENGNAQPLMRLLTDAIHGGMHKRFDQVVSKKNFKEDNVEAGREYVKAYVEFTHYVEALHGAATGLTDRHSQPSGATEAHKGHDH